MPELPEVEAMRRGLVTLEGGIIRRVTVADPRGISRHRAGRADFCAALTGRTLTACARRGKFLWMPLGSRQSYPQPTEPALPPSQSGGSTPGDADVALLAHMGMSGHILLTDPQVPVERATRVEIVVDRPGAGPLALRFVDQRTFGSMAVDTLVPTPDGHPAGEGETRPLLPLQSAHIARDPLDPWFDEGRFCTRLAARRSTVKRALLDQTLVSGIGNIYADESLWAARLPSWRPTPGMRRSTAMRLLSCVRDVLARACERAGTSFDTQYVDVNGRAGRFGPQLAVYGRAGLPCPRCGSAVRRIPFMNRSAYFCPRCQR